MAAALIALASPAAARAQALVPPPSPDREPPYFAYYAAVDFAAPLATDGICPDAAACVLSGGGGIELGVERHLPRGLSLGAAYGLWLLDAQGVYEIASIQSLSVRGRYELLADRRVHPFGGVALGLLLFGDTLAVATTGGALDLEVGVDVELDAAVRLRVSMPWRLYAFAPFRTPNDGVDRSSRFRPGVILAMRFALVVLETP